MTETEDVMTTAGELVGGADSKVIDEAIIDEAVRLIDGGLADLLHRELVSTDEISDLLLDVRSAASRGRKVQPRPYPRTPYRRHGR